MQLLAYCLHEACGFIGKCWIEANNEFYIFGCAQHCVPACEVPSPVSGIQIPGKTFDIFFLQFTLRLGTKLSVHTCIEPSRGCKTWLAGEPQETPAFHITSSLLVFQNKIAPDTNWPPYLPSAITFGLKTGFANANHLTIKSGKKTSSAQTTEPICAML